MKQLRIWMSLGVVCLLCACSDSSSTSSEKTRDKEVVIPEGAPDGPADPIQVGEGTADTEDSTRQLD